MSRARGPVELSEYATMARRVVRNFGDRFAVEGDEPELRQLHELGDVVDDAMRTAIEQMRLRDVSWAAIGRAVGMSGEGARLRWGNGKEI